MHPEAHSNAVLRPLEERDFGPLATLARAIWLAHYTTIITKEQIEFMLGGRFAPENLRRYLLESDRWLNVLEFDGHLVGYCSYAFTDEPGEMKLEQLYLLPALHGQGLGKRMLDHAEARTVQHGRQTLVLQVNKHNEKAIRVYRRAGYVLREEIVVDIGRGFIMDDYVMAKQLGT
ncbi:MAG: GNAT family N-acetyltransferase [Gammaproteobacteria bacterium]